jgi:hypothetical protein
VQRKAISRAVGLVLRKRSSDLRQRQPRLAADRGVLKLADDVDGPDIEGGESESQELKDLIDQWVQALDRWVQRIDQGMGSVEGVDPTTEPEEG